LLHGLGRPVFENLPRLEAVLRDFPEIDVVVLAQALERLEQQQQAEPRLGLTRNNLREVHLVVSRRIKRFDLPLWDGPQG